MVLASITSTSVLLEHRILTRKLHVYPNRIMLVLLARTTMLTPIAAFRILRAVQLATTGTTADNNVSRILGRALQARTMIRT